MHQSSGFSLGSQAGCMSMLMLGGIILEALGWAAVSSNGQILRVGPQGSYVLRFSNPTFSGTEGLMSPGACKLVAQDFAQIPVDIVTTNGAITVTSIRFTLNGTYNDADGSFTASANVPPIVGDSKVFAMQGTITKAGAITGTYSITVAPPTATCALTMAGAKNA